MESNNPVELLATEEQTAEKKDETNVATEVVPTEVTENAKEEIAEVAATAAVVKPTEIEVPVAEVTPVTTNGTTETPSKVDEIVEGLAAVTISTVAAAAPIEKIEEKIDEIVANVTAAVAPVETNKTVEEAPPAVTTNGTKHDDDEHSVEKINDVVAPAPAPAEAEAAPKMNGSSESPKIEVKEDIIATNQNQIISTTTADTDNILVEQKNLTNIISKDTNEDSHIIIDGGDCSDENAQKILSPLLSQPPPPLPCSPPPSQVMVFALSDIKNPDEINTTIEQESIKKQEICDVDDLPEPPPLPKEAINHDITDELPEAPPTPPILEELSDDNILEPPPLPSQYIQSLLSNVDEDQISSTDELAEKIEDIMMEKNTIQLIESDQSSGVVELIDDTKMDLVESSGGESQTLLQPIEPEAVEAATTIDNDNNIPSINDEKSELLQSSIEELTPKVDVETITKSITNEIELVADDVASALNKDALEKILAETLADGENCIEEEEPQQQPIKQQQHQQNQQKSKKKENGVEGNGENQEILATENGFDDHKTIEEIKAENQYIEQNAEVTQEQNTPITAE